MITTNPGTGILVFDTNPTCAKVYVNSKLYGSTEQASLQIMNVSPGRYYYSIHLKGKHYDNDVLVESGKITHIYINFNTGTKEEEFVYIGTTLTNFAKRELTQPSCTPTLPIHPKQPDQPQEPKEEFKYPFDNGEPILKDEPITISKHIDYYDISSTITTAGETDPNDFDSPVYNKEQIYKIKGRYAEKIIVVNDSSVTLYAIVSHVTSTVSYSKEVPIYAGEVKTYYNVYEIRLRSPTAGAAYRVAEYEIRSLSAIMKGTDGTNLQTVAVDSNGNIIAVMKGSDGVNLQTVSVDSSGRIVSVIKGTDASGNIVTILVDAAGKMLAVMQGDYAGTPKTLAVDSDGRMQAILYGTYGVTPTAIAVDAGGKLVVQNLAQTNIEGDLTEAQTYDSPVSNLLNNMNRIRNQIVAITGEAWGTVSHSIAAVWAKFHATTGHKHTGAADDSPNLAGTSVTNTPAGTIAATTVQAALNELDTEKESTSTSHAARHVTGGGDTVADAIAGGNSGLMSGAAKTKLDGIEALADVTDAVNIASSIIGVADKATPVDADSFGLIDSAAANVLKELTWASVKATIKAYTDTLYFVIISGTATITAGNIYVNVTHNVGTTPNWVHVDPTNEYGIDKFVDNIGATTFRINIQSPQPSDATFGWSAGM